MNAPLGQAIHLLAEALAEQDRERDAASRDMALRMQRRKRWEGNVDEIAVERALSGHPVDLNEDEMRAVVTELSRQGMPDSEISRRIRRTVRTVQRLRTKHHIPSGWVA